MSSYSHSHSRLHCLFVYALTHPPVKALHCMLRFGHAGDMVKETPIMWGLYPKGGKGRLGFLSL